jgi:myo-inositol-1(or 4)-monophosphatase
MTHDILQALQNEVREVGQLARDYFVSDSMVSEQKADGSVVTAIDTAIEQRLFRYIRTHFPNDTIVAEEGGGHQGDGTHVWYIDPIDGTDNFFRRIPFTAVSVARLGETAEDSVGIVYNPITDQMFSSAMNEGVYENTHIHQLHSTTEGGRAIVSVCRGKEPWMKTAAYNLQKQFGVDFGKGTAYGCCALEIAYIAANRIDGALVFGLNSYDYAAGLYLVESAGGSISVWRDEAWQQWTESIHVLCQIPGMPIFVSHAGIHGAAVQRIGDPRQWSDA